MADSWDHRLKLAHAFRHIKSLEEETRIYLATEPFQAVAQYSEDRKCYVAELKRVKPLPSLLSLITGDAIQSLRSSLDHLAFALACRFVGGEMPEADAKGIQFPIVDRAADWKGECARKLKLLSPEAQLAIKEMQPFTSTPEDARHVLSFLRDLSNNDKHRRLLLTESYGIDSKLYLSGPGMSPKKLSGDVGPIGERVILHQWRFSDIAEGEFPLFRIKGDMKIHIMLESIPPDEPANECLRNLHGFIGKHVCDPLESLL